MNKKKVNESNPEDKLPTIVIRERAPQKGSTSGGGGIPMPLKIFIYFLAIVLIIFVVLLTSMTNVSEAWFKDDFIYGTDERDEFRIVGRSRFNKKMVEMGSRVAKNETRLLVVSLVRNCRSSIPAMEKKLEVLSSVFKDVHAVFFENNSTDGTRTELLEYANGNKKFGKNGNVRVTVVNPFTLEENEEICVSSIDDFQNNDKAGPTQGASFKRIHRMTFIRNRALDYVYANQHNYDMLLMTDMDILGRIFPTGIQETVGYMKSIPDVGFVTFRGFYKNGGFFDPFSYRGTDIFSQSKFTTLLLCMKGFFIVPSGKGLYPVASSHSGGIFSNLPLPPSLRYSCEKVATVPKIGEVYLCEHIPFMERVKNNFVNTNMTFLVQHHV